MTNQLEEIPCDKSVQEYVEGVIQRVHIVEQTDIVDEISKDEIRKYIEDTARHFNVSNVEKDLLTTHI